MNSVVLSGNIGSDPEIVVSQSGTKVARFSLAVRRRFAKNGETDTDWFRLTSFKNQADFAERYLKKGSSVIIQGEVQNNDYEKDGVKHYSVAIIVNNIEFSGKKSDNEAPVQQAQDPVQYAQAPVQQPVQQTVEDYLGVVDGSLDDELPFM